MKAVGTDGRPSRIAAAPSCAPKRHEPRSSPSARATSRRRDRSVCPRLRATTRTTATFGTRLHYLARAHINPSFYQNFTAPSTSSLADYGGGSGVGCSGSRSGVARRLNNSLTGDWTTQRIYSMRSRRRDDHA
jgi:hypothetical protein